MELSFYVNKQLDPKTLSRDSLQLCLRQHKYVRGNLIAARIVVLFVKTKQLSMVAKQRSRRVIGSGSRMRLNLSLCAYVALCSERVPRACDLYGQQWKSRVALGRRMAKRHFTVLSKHYSTSQFRFTNFSQKKKAQSRAVPGFRKSSILASIAIFHFFQIFENELKATHSRRILF